jgi:hypothetical protein
MYAVIGFFKLGPKDSTPDLDIVHQIILMAWEEASKCPGSFGKGKVGLLSLSRSK